VVAVVDEAASRQQLEQLLSVLRNKQQQLLDLEQQVQQHSKIPALPAEPTPPVDSQHGRDHQALMASPYSSLIQDLGQLLQQAAMSEDVLRKAWEQLMDSTASAAAPAAGKLSQVHAAGVAFVEQLSTWPGSAAVDKLQAIRKQVGGQWAMGNAHSVA
jgi:hypothetical protein